MRLTQELGLTGAVDLGRAAEVIGRTLSGAHVEVGLASTDPVPAQRGPAEAADTAAPRPAAVTPPLKPKNRLKDSQQQNHFQLPRPPSLLKI